MLPALLLSLLPLALASPVQASPVQLPFLSSSNDLDASTPNYRALLSVEDMRRVPLSLGVMSKCPDASVCETLIDRVLDTHTYSTGREVVGDLVKLKLIYLAK